MLNTELDEPNENELTGGLDEPKENESRVVGVFIVVYYFIMVLQF
jgi:hypothetical protein